MKVSIQMLSWCYCLGALKWNILGILAKYPNLAELPPKYVYELLWQNEVHLRWRRLFARGANKCTQIKGYLACNKGLI